MSCFSRIFLNTGNEVGSHSLHMESRLWLGQLHNKRRNKKKVSEFSAECAYFSNPYTPTMSFLVCNSSPAALVAALDNLFSNIQTEGPAQFLHFMNCLGLIFLPELTLSGPKFNLTFKKRSIKI
jgi:hypothetical protein